MRRRLAGAVRCINAVRCALHALLAAPRTTPTPGAGM